VERKNIMGRKKKQIKRGGYFCICVFSGKLNVGMQLLVLECTSKLLTDVKVADIDIWYALFYLRQKHDQVVYVFLELHVKNAFKLSKCGPLP